jgi:hypothetical protein
MANIGRKFLTDHGVPDEQLDAIMNEINTTISNRLNGYIPQAEVQAQIDAALKSVKQPEPVDPKNTDEYKALESEFTAYRTMQAARTSEDFKDVKPKFFEQVYGMINREDGSKPVKEQLADIRGNYEEYFTEQQAPKPLPIFGAPTQGSNPKGEEGAVAQFQKAWGFAPKK